MNVQQHAVGRSRRVSNQKQKHQPFFVAKGRIGLGPKPACRAWYPWYNLYDVRLRLVNAYPYVVLRATASHASSRVMPSLGATYWITFIHDGKLVVTTSLRNMLYETEFDLASPERVEALRALGQLCPRS